MTYAVSLFVACLGAGRSSTECVCTMVGIPVYSIITSHSRSLMIIIIIIFVVISWSKTNRPLRQQTTNGIYPNGFIALHKSPELPFSWGGVKSSWRIKKGSQSQAARLFFYSRVCRSCMHHFTGTSFRRRFPSRLLGGKGLSERLALAWWHPFNYGSLTMNHVALHSY